MDSSIELSELKEMPMASKQTFPALEVTTFKLKKGLGMSDFMAANADVDAWLVRQPGFRSRHIAQQQDGLVADVLHWDSVAQGTRAMHRLLDELVNSPVHACIDQRTVKWSIAPIAHSLPRGGS